MEAVDRPVRLGSRRLGFCREGPGETLDFGKEVDIYEAAGTEKPDLTRLDEVFVKRLKQSMRLNLAIKTLRRRINRIEEENRAANRLNLVRRNALASRIEELFSARITAAMKRYENQALDSAEIVARLIDLARLIAADRGRAEAMCLTEAELAFCCRCHPK